MCSAQWLLNICTNLERGCARNAHILEAALMFLYVIKTSKLLLECEHFLHTPFPNLFSLAVHKPNFTFSQYSQETVSNLALQPGDGAWAKECLGGGGGGGGAVWTTITFSWFWSPPLYSVQSYGRSQAGWRKCGGYMTIYSLKNKGSKRGEGEGGLQRWHRRAIFGSSKSEQFLKDFFFLMWRTF